ncbi:hypothetical protein SEA_FIRECASTLE_25 [Microbacterium phage FireCastle]
MSKPKFTYRIRAVSPSGNTGQNLIVRAENKDDALEAFHDATQGKMVEYTIDIERLSIPAQEATP